MWEINNGFQLISVFRAAVLGGGFCLFYDILRAIRKHGADSYYSVLFQDLIYFLVCAPITFIFLLALTNGELRAYFFISLAVGFLLTRITVSILFLKLAFFIFSVIIKCYKFFKKVLNSFSVKITSTFNTISDFLIKKVKKTLIYTKKLLKKQ